MRLLGGRYIQHRHGAEVRHTSEFDGGNGTRIAVFGIDWVRCQVGDVNGRSGRHHAARWRYSTANGRVAAKFSKGTRRAVSCRKA